MKFRRFFIILFSLFFTFSGLHGQTSPSQMHGKELSDFVFNELSSRGISPRRMQLCRTQENNFPYNISINISRTEGFASHRDSQYNTFLFIFNQENIIDHFDFIENFARWNKETDFDFNVNILLTACDKSQISGNDSMTGTNVYATLIEGTESYCAIYSNFDAVKLTTLTPGSGKKVCPLWLTDLTNEALEKNGINPVIKGSYYLSLYKLDILMSSRNLTSLLQRNIPSIELNFKKADISDTLLLQIYKDFILSFSERTSFQSDTHYIPLEIFDHHYWISEDITIIFLLILVTLSLITICDLGFIFRSRHSKKTLVAKRAIKTFYLLPATIIVLAFCLEIAQFFAAFLFNSFLRNPIAVLGIKLVLSFILISFAYLIELKFHNKANSFSYEYILNISSLLNIFIFSAIDISLFYLFAVIYILIFISQYFKKSISLYIFFLLSFMPYLQLVFAITTYSNPTQIMPLIFANHLYNLIFACAITPLSIMLLRIYLDLKKRQSTARKTESSAPVRTKKHFTGYYALILVITIIIFSGLIVFGTYYIRNIFIKKVDFTAISGRIIDAPQNHFLNAKYSDSNYYGGTIRQIAINTEKKAARVEVFVSGESENPIFYTTYSFTSSGAKNQIQFDFPDYPPENFKVTYTPDNSAVSIVTIYAYYDSDYYPKEIFTNELNSRRKTFVKEKSAIVISSTGN